MAVAKRTLLVVGAVWYSGESTELRDRCVELVKKSLALLGLSFVICKMGIWSQLGSKNFSWTTYLKNTVYVEKWKRNSYLEEFALQLWRHLWK